MTVSDARRGEPAVGRSERVARDDARAAGGARARLSARTPRDIRRAPRGEKAFVALRPYPVKKKARNSSTGDARWEGTRGSRDAPDRARRRPCPCRWPFLSRARPTGRFSRLAWPPPPSPRRVTSFRFYRSKSTASRRISRARGRARRPRERRASPRALRGRRGCNLNRRLTRAKRSTLVRAKRHAGVG